MEEKCCITPDMISSDLIAAHLKSDDRLKGILDPQAEGVAQSLCNLLNLLVEPQNKENTDGEISDMDQDENEDAAERDHQRAEDMIEGKKSAWKTARRKRGKQAGAEQMDQTAVNAGKRGADDAETEEPPAPKCLMLPPGQEIKGKTEHFNLEEADAAAAAAATAKAAAASKEEVKRTKK